MKSTINELGYMIDCSRGAVAKLSTLKRLVDFLSSFGYSYLMLYTEDTYEIKEEPYFGYMRGRYSHEEIKELDEYCKGKGMELRPCIQTLAHLGRLQAGDGFNDLFDIDDILLVGDEKVYAFIEKMFKNVFECFSSKKIHIGMDEAFQLGRGKYINRFGYEKKSSIISKHLKRVSEIAKRYGYTCYIWADMLENAFREDEEHYSCSIPDNVIPTYWGYERLGREKAEEKIRLYKKLSPDRLSSCGGIIKWVGFSPLNTYSMPAVEEQIDVAKKYDLEDYLVTGWGDGAGDAGQFTILPGLFYAGLIANGKTLSEETKKVFLEATGMSFDDFMNVDALSTLDPSVDYKEKRNSLPLIHLYSDLLQDPMMECALDKYESLYAKAMERLSPFRKQKDFGYMFDALYHLADTDQYLCTLGRKIREAYIAKRDLFPEIETARKAYEALEGFIKAYERQWAKENKAFGYEKQLLRLGGLKERIRYVIDVLASYQKGEISQIDELEEKHLPKYVGDKIVDDPDATYANWYRYFVSSGILNDN